MNARDEARELRATITAITGKVPASFNLTYLRRRLAMLAPKEQTVDGHDLIALVGGHGIASQLLVARSIMDVIGSRRAMLVTEIAKPRRQTVNDVIKRAIDEYAVRQGYGAFVERIRKSDG